MRTHSVEKWRPEYPKAYVANGLVGLRVGPIPLLGGTALVNGFVGAQEGEMVESYAPAPYPVAADLCVNGLWLSQRPDLAAYRGQSYDFSCGELTSRFDLSVNGATARVEVITFCSRSMPTLACQQITVEVDKDCTLVLRGILEGTGLPGRCLSREVPDPGWQAADGALHWEGRAGLSTCGAAVVNDYVGEGSPQRKRNPWGLESALTTDYAVQAKPGQQYILRQLGSLVPSLMHAEPERQAIRLVYIGRDFGFQTLRDDNRNAWAELWKGRVKLVGADARWQDIADAAFFYVHSSVHRSSPCSVASFGLSQWRHYHGHVFWDAETWTLPSVLLTAPDAARAMLDYRTRLLPGARTNAALQGYRGVQFPWSTLTHGGEVMSAWACGIFKEHHVNLDVAFGFAQYAHASGDDEFIRAQAWPVLRGVADWIVSRVTKTARGYEIRHVEGIDEGRYNMNNNGYMNPLATVILAEAQAMAGRLGQAPPAAWEQVRDKMYIPIDSVGRFIKKDDAYESDQPTQHFPDPLVSFFPQTYRPDEAVEKATIRHYLSKAQTFMSAPMLPGLMGVFAARLGEREFASELFEAGVGNFVTEPFMQFTEFARQTFRNGEPPVTLYVTTAAGFLMTCMYGLTGVQLGPLAPATWCKLPVIMPAAWQGVEVERIFARGREARLSARHGDQRAKIDMT
jgi:trehalose/maltose hydrolase-like predicted phosphorylase